MSRLKVLLYRIYDNLKDKHQWEERVHIRWCTRCGWIEIDDPVAGWVTYDFDKVYLWITPREATKISKEFYEYLVMGEGRDW